MQAGPKFRSINQSLIYTTIRKPERIRSNCRCDQFLVDIEALAS